METMKNLSQLIRDFRRENHISLRAMGALIGCSSTNVSLIERNETLPSSEQLKRISICLDVPLEDILRITYREENGLYKTYLTETEMKARKEGGKNES